MEYFSNREGITAVILFFFFLLCKTRLPIQNALAELLHPGCSLDYPLVILAA